MIWSWIAGKVWWIAAVAALLALFLGQEARVSNAKARTSRAEMALADYRATAEAAARTASEAARAEETRRNDERDKAIQEAHDALQTAKTNADGARLELDGMRKRVAAITSASRPSTGNAGSGIGSQGKQDQAALDLLVQLLDRHSSELVDVGEYADKLKIAGQACERQYDRLTLEESPSVRK